jgi:hypothetical protein
MKRNFIYLAVLTLAALLVAFVFTPGDGPSEQTSSDNLLMPEIAAQINDVNRVEIVSAGNLTVATMLRSGDNWQLEQMGGYHADWPKLQTLLAALAQARVVETKTDKAEYYSRLGVEDVEAEDASSVLVKLAVGDQITGILIGHRAQGRQGQYVRLQNATASALVDREIDVPGGQLDWADSRIVDIGASEIAEVEVIHPGGERILVTKISADQTDFDLVGLPTDREIKSSWAVNSLGSVFSLLDMETVRPAGDFDWSAAVKMRLLTFSGTEIMAEMVEAGDEYLLRLNASHPAADVIENPAEGQEIPAEQQDIEKRALDDVTQTVESINQKVEGWVYGIAKHKYEALVKKPEDLLKPLES